MLEKNIDAMMATIGELDEQIARSGAAEPEDDPAAIAQFLRGVRYARINMAASIPAAREAGVAA